MNLQRAVKLSVSHDVEIVVLLGAFGVGQQSALLTGGGAWMFLRARVELASYLSQLAGAPLASRRGQAKVPVWDHSFMTV